MKNSSAPPPKQTCLARRSLSIRRLAILLLLLAGIIPPPRLQAIIFYFTADPDYNTTAPTGSLAGSGWQWVGSWGGFQGTVIGPHHFLAAQHVGGVPGDPFVFQGVSYRAVAFIDDPTTDLRIVEVAGDFPTWAPLYRRGDEAGKTFVVFGRGSARGAEVWVDNVLKGWQWGAAGTLRWGQNSVARVVNLRMGGGDHLYARFESTGGVNECHLASGDSSGPIFIDDGSGYKLAGVAHVVDGPFNTRNTGDGFNAALFDIRGLYARTAGKDWKYVAGFWPVPSGFFATRVSVRTQWIDSVLRPSPPKPLVSPPAGTG